MTDNSAALRRSRRRESNNKRRRAAETLQAMIDSGEAITFPAVARRAGVSVSLLYADTELAGRLAEARSRQQGAGRDRAAKLPVRSLVSEQGLRADLANAHKQVRRLRDEVNVLRDRFAHALGEAADQASGRTTHPLLYRLEAQTAQLEQDNARLRDMVAELEAAVRETPETLEAARAMNRGINRTGPPANVRPTTPA